MWLRCYNPVHYLSGKPSILRVAQNLSSLRNIYVRAFGGSAKKQQENSEDENKKENDNVEDNQMKANPLLKLRTVSDDQKKKAQEFDDLIHKKQEKQWIRQQEILNELKNIKAFIESNRNNSVAIMSKIKSEIYSFDPIKSTASHKTNNTTTGAEVLRRYVWLCQKYLNDENWHNLVTSDHTLATMENLFDFLHKNAGGLTTEEVCDLLWTLATLGYRPFQLVQSLVSFVDRCFRRYYMRYENVNEFNEPILPENKSPDQDILQRLVVWRQMDEDNSGENNDKSRIVELPVRPNEFADIVFAYGQLRVQSGAVIKMLYKIVDEHFSKNNRLLDQFLPKDLSNLAVGYAMMDPAFQQYEISWGLNRHLNLLGAHVPWTFHEKLNILHYDVIMRYINQGWKLRITGDLQKLIDNNFIENLPRLVPPFYDPFLQQIYDSLQELLFGGQYYCKNVEGLSLFL
ncbi:hypothetical protein RFI_40187 [Reticulomyxa filosa]|uniref:Uncharacterized protein n=1 Tax=Reticulomyxa filosa TaxID=46433 RepID=X6L8H2_RETFI|nr:hypothetical protein RFI_40187 [Reticulomyxa filosa]|eukprot:ETN97346.1 hypothetical protein RFI_40187 [Reticulomyxa filosa]